MNKKNAIFVIGSPGSGKDVILRDISSNYHIVEFTSVQLNEMLTDGLIFSKARQDKKNSLLNSESILISCKSYDLDFVTTKHILDDIGYSTHLILVEADINSSYERVKTRNLKESMDRISQGNANRGSIIGMFTSNIIVDNSYDLNLMETRIFVNKLLNELVFECKISVSDIISENIIKKKIKNKYIPDNTIDASGLSYNPISTFEFESADAPSSDSTILGSTGVEDFDSNKEKRNKATLLLTKKVLFNHRVYPKDI